MYKNTEISMCAFKMRNVLAALLVHGEGESVYTENQANSSSESFTDQ